MIIKIILICITKKVPESEEKDMVSQIDLLLIAMHGALVGLHKWI